MKAGEGKLCPLTLDHRATGIMITGGCGEIVTFHANQVLTEDSFTARACASFRKSVLEVYGAGGSRRVAFNVEGFMPSELGRRPTQIWVND